MGGRAYTNSQDTPAMAGPEGVGPRRQIRGLSPAGLLYYSARSLCRHQRRDRAIIQNLDFVPEGLVMRSIIQNLAKFCILALSCGEGAPLTATRPAHPQQAKRTPRTRKPKTNATSDMRSCGSNAPNHRRVPGGLAGQKSLDAAKWRLDF